MEGLLHTLLELFENIPQYILYSLETLLNTLFSGIGAAVNAVIAVLPSLPEASVPPEYVAYVNWFIPLGAILSVGGGLLASYVTFLSVRWLLVKAGLIG